MRETIHTSAHMQSHEDAHHSVGDEECQSWHVSQSETMFFCQVKTAESHQMWVCQDVLSLFHVVSLQTLFQILSDFFNDSQQKDSWAGGLRWSNFHISCALLWICCWSVVLKTKTWLKDHYSAWKLGLERSHESVFEHLYQNEQKSMFYKSVPNKNLSLTLWILMRLLFNPDHSRNVTSHFSPIMATPTSNQQETKTQKQTEKHLMNNQFWSDCAGCVLRLDLTHIIRCKTSSIQHVSLSQVYVVYASGLFLYVLKEYSCMTYRLDSSNKSTSINISIRDQSSFSLQFII